MRLDPAATDAGLSHIIPPAIEQAELQSPFDSFPTSNQPVRDTQLKEMLCMQILLTSPIHFQKKCPWWEKGLTKYITKTVNDIICANEESEEERHWMLAKIADLEDRSRRNNVKLREVPETMPAQDISQYCGSHVPWGNSLIPTLTYKSARTYLYTPWIYADSLIRLTNRSATTKYHINGDTPPK